MVTRALDIDFGQVAMEGLAVAGGGAALRLAWDQSDNIGMFGTGIFIVGGLIGRSMTRRGDILNTVFDAAFHSGAAVAGWLFAERTFDLGALEPGAAAPGVPSFEPHAPAVVLPANRHPGVETNTNGRKVLRT